MKDDENVERRVVLYGYVRGTFFRAGGKVCLPGAGDYAVHEVTRLEDPCPLPDKTKARTLNMKQKMLCATPGPRPPPHIHPCHGHATPCIPLPFRAPRPRA